jgi:hypothetical protein
MKRDPSVDSEGSLFCDWSPGSRRSRPARSISRLPSASRPTRHRRLPEDCRRLGRLRNQRVPHEG